MFARLLTNTKSIQMIWSNDSRQKQTNKTSFKTKSKRDRERDIESLERSTLLNKINAKLKNVIPFPVTYSATLPNIWAVINQQWHKLNINNTFRNLCKVAQVKIHRSFCKNYTFRKNALLRQIIGTDTISKRKKLLKVK